MRLKPQSETTQKPCPKSFWNPSETLSETSLEPVWSQFEASQPTSKTKLFWETSSFFQVDNIKNEAIPSKMESWVQSWWPRTNAFCDFSSQCLWSIARATRKWCQVIQSAAPVTQNHFPKTDDLMLQNATPPSKSAPWPPNSSDEHVSCTAPDSLPL